MANQTVTYVLWFFLGWLGVHHFYLKRDRHAFVWWATLGGLFGLGWIRDIWRIPDYVQECNEDEEFYKKKKERGQVINGNAETRSRPNQNQISGDGIVTRSTTESRTRNRTVADAQKNVPEGDAVHLEEKKQKTVPHVPTTENRTQKRTVAGAQKNGPERDAVHLEEKKQKTVPHVPNCSTVRFSGQLVMGSIFSYLFRLSIPEEYAQLDGIKWVVFFLPPIGAAVGLLFIGTNLVCKYVGRHKCSWTWPLIGSFSALPWLFYSNDSIASSPLLAVLFTNWWGKKGRSEPPPRKGLCKRLTVLSCCGIIYLLLLTSTIYFNATVTVKDGETVPLREAIQNFFKSPVWSDTKEQFHRLYNYYQANGWHKIWEEIMSALDPAGEANAYKVLELDHSATQEEITKRYRELSRKWHPDRHKDLEAKAEAQKKFIEIQEAYDILSQIRAKRTKRNKQSTRNERTEF
ncbi:dnaJ homolog subfamily C member 22-like [Gigantopelta aegis]|uniref:dnaJ homolog subfamily C member 22-like n=1 Tax=Gigantopelta aegis TaxID=1735272 RepID=UPI001B889241|nr:dnaJ homolog subfamily C member 22-like [Gigantopelta aegis]